MPRSARKVLTALMSPMVPMEIRSSLIVRLCIVFLDDVGHQPEIVLHQPVPPPDPPLRPRSDTPAPPPAALAGGTNRIPRQTQRQNRLLDSSSNAADSIQIPPLLPAYALRGSPYA